MHNNEGHDLQSNGLVSGTSQVVKQSASCWRVIPIVLVLAYRLFIYGSIIYISPSTILSPGLFECIMWPVAAIAVLFYLRTSCFNPGFQDWCPSAFLSPEERKRANDVKAKLLLQAAADQQQQAVIGKASNAYTVATSSSGTSDVADNHAYDDDDEDTYNATESSDLEFGTLDLGADMADTTGTGGLRVVRSGAGNVIVASDPMPQRKKIRRIHTPPEVANGRGSLHHQPHTDSLEIAIENVGKSKTPNTSKRVRWRNKSLALVFMFRGVLQSLREWTLVCSIPYSSLTKSKTRNFSIEDGGDYKAPFSMGVHVMYQHQEKLQFCDKCGIWKLLRTKHCRSCQRCVRLHDHHCPWLGVCVGERNRVHFFWFLGWQTIELFCGMCAIVRSVLIQDTEWMDEAKKPDAAISDVLLRVVLLVMIMVLGCLCIMTLCLFFYHFFLVGTNLTTWETVSWHKITYLKSKKKAYGSPFGSQTCKANCILALIPFLPEGRRSHQLLKIDPVDKIVPSRVVIGPDNAMIWKAKQLGDSDYAKVPPCTRHPCCNVYEACL